MLKKYVDLLIYLQNTFNTWLAQDRRSAGNDTRQALTTLVQPAQKDWPCKSARFWRGSNSRPSACKADVITTTPQNQAVAEASQYGLVIQT